MNRSDELEQLWKTQPADAALRGEEMRKIIVGKMLAFDRRIQWRNRIETLAALAVAAFFAYAGWMQRNGIERAGCAIIVAGALYIIFYIRRNGGKARAPDPNPDQTIEGYQCALVSKYDHQILLLRSVKYWYLAPMYIGLLTLSAGRLWDVSQEGALTWDAVTGPVIYTLVFAAVWWLNEVYAVGKLKRARSALMAGMDGDDVCE
jgi:hypothetical protein